MSGPVASGLAGIALGQEFTGRWHVLDAASVETFEQATFVDVNDVEMDAARYPDNLVEGFHQVGLLEPLTRALDLLPSWTSTLTAVHKVRFTSPITAGQPFRLRGAVTAVEPVPGGTRLTADGVLEVQGRDKPGSVLQWEQTLQREATAPAPLPPAPSGHLATELLSASEPFHLVPGLVGRRFSGPWLQLDPRRLQAFHHAVGLGTEARPSADRDAPLPGTYLLGLLDHLVNPVVHVSDGAYFGWNYGLDWATFPQPARSDDRVRATGVVSSVVARGQGHLVCMDVQIDIAGRPGPAAATSWRALWLPER